MNRFTKGKRRVWLSTVGTTQFEATGARRAFPCFDEPSFKAEFETSILTPPGYNSVSNMPVEEISTMPGGNLYKFKKSVRMPAYLLAFVVSKFSYLVDGNYRVYAQPKLVDQGMYTLKIVKKLIGFTENYLDQKFPLPKMDVVAMPDFLNNAMENWGLLICREKIVLHKPNETSDLAKKQITTTMSHEVAHQWFGNLATPKWWTHTWLSESFASYFEYVGVDEMEPTWEIKDQLFLDKCRWALGADGTEDSPSIFKNVTSESEIGASFNPMTYNKGACVLRMMELTVGPTIFQNALRRYIRNKKFDNAVTDDLWEAFQSEFDEEGLGLRAKETFEPWITQSGYPVLSVRMNQGSMTVTQERFFYRNLNNSADSSTTWPVPISWVSLKNPSKKSEIYWLKNRTAEIKLDFSEDDVVIVNKDSAGHYRINYDQKSWNKIIEILKSDGFEKIPAINRAAIIDDILNLARIGSVDYDLAFEALGYLRKEMNYLPIKSAADALYYLVKKFDEYEGKHVFHKYLRNLITNVYDKVSFTEKSGDDHLTVLLRAAVTEFACRVSHEDCTNKAVQRLMNWKDKNIPIPKNERLPHIYNTALKYVPAAYWEFAWEEYKKSDVPSDKIFLLQGLGHTWERELLDRLLLRALSTSQHDIRQTDATALFKNIYSTSLRSTEYIMDFVEKNPDAFKDFSGNRRGSKFTIADIIIEAAKNFPTHNTRTKLKDFGEKFIISSESSESSKKTFNKALEIVNFEVDWSYKNLEKITSCAQNSLNQLSV